MNLNHYGSKGYASVILSDLSWGRGGCSLLFISLLCSGYIQHCSTRALNFIVFHTSEGISSRLVAFLFLIFVSTTSKSS